LKLLEGIHFGTFTLSAWKILSTEFSWLSDCCHDVFPGD
jgi:hypothetical protein